MPDESVAARAVPAGIEHKATLAELSLATGAPSFLLLGASPQPAPGVPKIWGPGTGFVLVRR